MINLITFAGIYSINIFCLNLKFNLKKLRFMKELERQTFRIVNHYIFFGRVVKESVA